MTDKDSEIRELLLNRKKELDARLERIHANVSRLLPAGSKERAKELEDSEVVDALGNDAVSEMSLLRAALERLDGGHYGKCTRCKADIGPARLKARPYAALCINCAEDAERETKRA